MLREINNADCLMRKRKGTVVKKGKKRSKRRIYLSSTISRKLCNDGGDEGGPRETDDGRWPIYRGFSISSYVIIYGFLSHARNGNACGCVGQGACLRPPGAAC